MKKYKSRIDLNNYLNSMIRMNHFEAGIGMYNHGHGIRYAA